MCDVNVREFRDLERLDRRIMEWLMGVAGDLKSQIEDAIIKTGGSVSRLVDELSINGRVLRVVFGTEKVANLCAALKRMVAAAPDAPSLLQDVLEIVCLIATVAINPDNSLSSSHAEKAWMQLAGEFDLHKTTMTNKFDNCKEEVQELFEAICALLPAKPNFFFRIVTLVVAAIEYCDDSIARYLGDHWKELSKPVKILMVPGVTSASVGALLIATGVAPAAGAFAVTAGAGYLGLACGIAAVQTIAKLF